MHYFIRETKLKNGNVRLEIFKEIEQLDFADIKDADAAISTLTQTLYKNKTTTWILLIARFLIERR